MNSRVSFRLGVGVLAGIAACLIATAGTRGEDGPRGLRAQPRAGFQITPLVHHAEGRPGQRIPFEFDIRGRGGETSLEVRVVGLAQGEDGRIHASDEAAPDGVRLETPDRLDVADDGTEKIVGEVTLPADTSYLVFGILVRDTGRPVPTGGAAGERRVHVNFITQYVLRVEVRVHGGRGAGVSDLRLDDGGLVDGDGLALARVYLENPTATAVEFEAQARLLRTDRDPPTPLGPLFHLHHPVRAGEPTARRRHVRVLGRSRVRLESLVPEPVFEGRYAFEVRLVSPTRRIERSFPLEVAEDEFPAQRAVVARTVAAVQVSPPAVELSSGRGGDRLATLALHNTAAGAVRLRVAPTAFRDDSAKGITVRPDEVTLGPGRKRSVIVTMSGGGEAAARYLLLEMEVEPEDGGVGGVIHIPVAVNVSAEAPRRAEIDPPRWLAEQGELAVRVANAGRTHLVLDAEARLSDPFGRGIALRGGFGRWLLPGDDTELHLKPPRPLPPGTYELELRLRTAPDGEHEQHRATVTIP